MNKLFHPPQPPQPPPQPPPQELPQEEDEPQPPLELVAGIKAVARAEVPKSAAASARSWLLS